MNWRRWFLTLAIAVSSGWCVTAVQRVYSQEQEAVAATTESAAQNHSTDVPTHARAILNQNDKRE